MIDNVSLTEVEPQTQSDEAEKNKETTPETNSKILIPVKFNKQIINLDIAQAGELAQKGMKFDAISKEYELLRGLAVQDGKSVSEYINTLSRTRFLEKKALLTEKCGGDEDLAEHILQLENQGTEEIRGFDELKESFPEIRDIEALPQTVVENARLKGTLLLDEYLRYRLQSQITVRDSLLKQKKAAVSATGSQQNRKGGVTPEAAEFLKGLWHK